MKRHTPVFIKPSSLSLSRFDLCNPSETSGRRTEYEKNQISSLLEAYGKNIGSVKGGPGNIVRKDELSEAGILLSSYGMKRLKEES
jgi:hypothetical protein